MTTKVEWVARPGTIPESWSPVTGCNIDGERIKASPGCNYCWAERFARRLAGRYGYPEQPHHFDVTLHGDRLEQPLRWKRPRTVFVCGMGDLFHKDVPTGFIHRIFDNMFYTPWHTFLILTKRPQRMAQFIDVLYHRTPKRPEPIQNIWLGVTAENQETADERIPILLQIPAVIRFVSCEPLLEPIALYDYLLWNGPYNNNRYSGISWVISGGESGPNARPVHPDWARSIRDQTKAASLPFFFKQSGEWLPGSKELLKKGYGSKWTVVPVNEEDKTPQIMWKIGRKAAGRLLDGREWNEWPA